MDAAQASRVITEPVWRDEIEQLSATRVRLDAVDELPGITPAMFDWWFAHMDRETYFKFHPDDHKAFSWTRGKRPGAYVGATHLTYHQYGGSGPVLRSEITFVEPSEMFDAETLATPDVGVVLVAVSHLLDEQDRPAAAESGRFTHVAMRRDYGTELRSRWWINVGPDTDLDLVTKGRLRHVHEEFGYLQQFLPGLYAERTAG